MQGQVGYRVLVVEDSQTQALRLRFLLEGEGWEVLHAATAAAALELLSRDRPDLIVVDHSLPASDDLRARIRAAEATSSIPILLLTVEERGAAVADADDQLAKSAAPDELLAHARALLQPDPDDPAEAFFRRARLLAVDDSRTYLEYLAGILDEEGYQVQLAHSGKEALSRLDGESFDCVLVDLIMPDVDGIEVCRRINELRMASKNLIVVLMLTARESKDDMTLGLEAGADDFVGKSSDVAVLKGRIRALLRRKFFEEENKRIVEELKDREREAAEARAARELADTRARLLADLSQKHEALKQAQVRLLQAEKLASLGQLVAGVAHEMNNPLAFVINNLVVLGRDAGFIRELLELYQRADDAPDEERQQAREAVRSLAARIDLPYTLRNFDELLERSREGLDRIRRIVADLRGFARLDESDFNAVDLNGGIASTLNILRGEAAKRSVVLLFEPTDIPKINCFPTKINQVVLNLVANAIQACAPGGKVTVLTSAVANGVEVAVADTGSGIPLDIQGKIFDPFFTTKPQGVGMGLGLSTSYGIVQDHGGRIDFESEIGRGTRFAVWLPIDPPPPAGDEATGAH